MKKTLLCMGLAAIIGCSDKIPEHGFKQGIYKTSEDKGIQNYFGRDQNILYQVSIAPNNSMIITARDQNSRVIGSFSNINQNPQGIVKLQGISGSVKPSPLRDLDETKTLRPYLLNLYKEATKVQNNI